MPETKRDYAVGRGKPPMHTRFKKGQSDNPRGPRPKNLPALLIEALDEPVTVTIDGERREITKRQAIATQLVNKSTGADLRATKMLINALKDAEKRAGAAPPAEPAPFTAADEEVMATFIARLRQSWEEELQQKAPSGIIARMMTSPGKFTWTTYDTVLRLDFVSFAQRCLRELSPPKGLELGSCP